MKIRQEIVGQLKDDLPELVDKFNHFILASFKSKKNDVVKLTFNKPTERLPREVIVKIFRTNNYHVELETLNKLKQEELNVPRILFHKNPFLILEYIGGVNLCDFINDNLKGVYDLSDLTSELQNQLISSIEELASWMVKYHQKNIIELKDSSGSIVLNKGDTRLRDFIFNPSKNEIYGLDFEEAYQGNHIDDIAWICCSLLDTNPGIFDVFNPKPKINLINTFLKEYYQLNPSFQFDFNYFTEKLIENLNIVMKRREIHLNLSKENFLKEIAKEP